MLRLASLPMTISVERVDFELVLGGELDFVFFENDFRTCCP